MVVVVVAYLISYVIRFVVLTLLLWTMIRLQKLNYSFLGLLGSAALAAALDMIPIFGHFLAVPVLYLCIWKVTGASLVPDAVFTVAVAYALMFALRVLLITALPLPLLGGRMASASLPVQTENNRVPEVDPNDPAGTNALSAAAKTNAWLKEIVVKGATENGAKSMVLISANKKNYTLVTDEETVVQTTTGPCHMRLLHLSEPWAILEVNGETANLRIH